MNIYIITLITVIILAIAGLSLSYLKGIGKSFRHTEPESSIETTSLADQQKRQAENTEEQRRAYMERVQQQIRDNRRR